MIDWNDSYYHKCEFCKHRGPTTSKLTGDGPVHQCWCIPEGIPGQLHQLYRKACERGERTTVFDKEADK